jgi:hypothetical protein
MRFWLNECSDEEYRAYAAPFPDESYKQGAREFPTLVQQSLTILQYLIISAHGKNLRSSTNLF